jgi:hypothetical protein
MMAPGALPLRRFSGCSKATGKKIGRRIHAGAAFGTCMNVVNDALSLIGAQVYTFLQVMHMIGKLQFRVRTSHSSQRVGARTAQKAQERAVLILSLVLSRPSY